MRSRQIPCWLICSVIAVIARAILCSAIRSFWYFEFINNDGVGIAIEARQIRGIKQPDSAYDIGLFVDLVKVKTSAVALTPEFDLQ